MAKLLPPMKAAASTAATQIRAKRITKPMSREKETVILLRASESRQVLSKQLAW
jgi:hypothetical protein